MSEETNFRTSYVPRQELRFKLWTNDSQPKAENRFIASVIATPRLQKLQIPKQPSKQK